MPLPIIEQPLFGQIKFETSPWAATFVWTDRTADLVSGFNYAQGGRVGPPGASQVDVGTLNATFKNLASVPAVGALVRLSLVGSTDWIFVGYVQDVSQRIVFDNSVSYNTPITLTTLNCVDWVGYISQFQTEGVGGLAAGTFNKLDRYNLDDRVRALNNVIDPTNNTALITFTGTTPANVGDTDYVGTIADHLDLVSRTLNVYWFGNHNLPSNRTTGRFNLVGIIPFVNAVSSGITFTDEIGTSGQLHYTEIDLESSSQNVSNTIIINNSSVITATSLTPLYDRKLISQIGGANRQNFKIVNGLEITSVPYEQTWQVTDSTSIATYGNRATVMDTNLAGLVDTYNLASNPSAEYSDTGYNGGANTVVRRRKPNEADPLFNAYSGEWAIRMRQQTAATTGSIQFNGSESDGTPIIPGNLYFARAFAARGNPSRPNLRARIIIRWLNDAEAVVASSTGAQVSLTNLENWYQVIVSGNAPATATRARVNVEFSRADGTNISAGDYAWMDGLILSTNNPPFFDGDTQPDNSYVYLWTGEVGLSPSFRILNNIDDLGATYLSRYSTTSNRVTRIRWNAQENIASVPALRVGRTVNIRYDGTTTNYRIVGVDGNVDPERYMIDYYLERV